MDLRSLFQRMFNEQQWREQQASKLGLYAPGTNQPLTDGTTLSLEQLFKMNPRMQSLNEYWGRETEKDNRLNEVMNGFEKELGPMPNWFWNRFKQKEWMEQRQKDTARLHNSI